MAKSLVVQIRTGLTRLSHKPWVHRDANDVVSGRNRRLSISSVQNKILTPELPDVSVRPPDADSLVTRYGGFSGRRRRATGQIVAVVIRGARIGLIFLYVDHAEASFGGAPYET